MQRRIRFESVAGGDTWGDVREALRVGRPQHNHLVKGRVKTKNGFCFLRNRTATLSRPRADLNSRMSALMRSRWSFLEPGCM